MGVGRILVGDSLELSSLAERGETSLLIYFYCCTHITITLYHRGAMILHYTNLIIRPNT